MYSSNPKEIYGISPINSHSTACITEIMYTKAFDALPTKNVVTDHKNINIHRCARTDSLFKEQIVLFIEENMFMDVCASSDVRCVRDGIWC